MFVRNSIGVLLGLLVAFATITTGITINKSVFFPELDQDLVENWKVLYQNWRVVLRNAHYKFYIALLFSAGIAAILGGVVTSFIVKEAKEAYAILIGFILTFVSWIDVFFTPGHPIWYIVSLNVVLFFFSWLGGKLVKLFSKET